MSALWCVHLREIPLYAILNYFKGNFSTPLKRNVQYFHPPSSRSSKNFDPLTCRPPPYCWVKNDQPLIDCLIGERYMSQYQRFTISAIIDYSIASGRERQRLMDVKAGKQWTTCFRFLFLVISTSRHGSVI